VDGAGIVDCGQPLPAPPRDGREGDGMSTIPVIFVGHGGYPDGVRDAVEMILGEQPRVATVSLAPHGSTEEIAERSAPPSAATVTPRSCWPT